MTLDEFRSALQSAADAIYERRWPEGTKAVGGGNGPGPHWGVRGDENKMLSPSLEELSVLFAVSRALRPRRIMELGTGTGLSVAALALGWPEAGVTTADDFRVLDCEAQAREAWAALGVAPRVELVRGDWHRDWPDGPVDLLFGDGAGYYPRIFGGTRGMVTVVHDLGGYIGERPARAWYLDTSSVLGLWGKVPERVLSAVAAVSLVVPGDRICRVGETTGWLCGERVR